MRRYNFWMAPSIHGGALIYQVPIMRTVTTNRALWRHRKHPKAFLRDLDTDPRVPARFMRDPYIRFWRDTFDERDK